MPLLGPRDTQTHTKRRREVERLSCPTKNNISWWLPREGNEKNLLRLVSRMRNQSGIVQWCDSAYRRAASFWNFKAFSFYRNEDSFHNRQVPLDHSCFVHESIQERSAARADYGTTLTGYETNTQYHTSSYASYVFDTYTKHASSKP